MAKSAEKQIVAERVGGLTDKVLESVDAGRQAAVEAVRKFAGTLEEATSKEGKTRHAVRPLSRPP